jgi:hypothetical protein
MPTLQMAYSANYMVYDSNHHAFYGADQQGSLVRGVTG